MRSNRFLRTLIILALLTVNIGCDQVSKSIVRSKMTDYTYISYLNNHITLTKVQNTGAFLSLGDSLSGPLKIILLNILPLLAVAFGLYFILTHTTLNRITLLGVIMTVGGGFGNIYDRIVHGSVTDFMHIDFVIFQTGIFNVADVSIMIGMLIILVQAYFHREKPAETES